MNVKAIIGRQFRMLLTDISPVLNTKYVYRRTFGEKLDLSNPVTLDEKIQWLKLHTYYKNQLVTECADKYKVREYVENCGCGEILNDLYGVYDSPDEINWSELPEKFVIKWNFGCGQNFICRNKNQYNEQVVKKMLWKWRKAHRTFYRERSEMQYKDIVPKLICEKLIETDNGDLPKDYKLYCFNGVADCALVCTDRLSAGHANYYFFDRNWNLKRYNKMGLAAPGGFTLPKPYNFEKLFDYAEVLSRPFPFVRADFYLEKGEVTFGELTFTPGGGFDKGRLPSTQKLFGDKLYLPDAN